MLEDELTHYGVPGMKWGVRKAERRYAKNQRLAVKAAKYDQKSANYTKRSEKIHAKQDLGRANRKAVKAAKYDKQAAKLDRKALTTDSESKQYRYAQKSGQLRYKAAKARIAGNRISKTTGYGVRAMKYSIKSDRVAAQAAKARMKIANNEAYIAKTKQKVNTLSDAEKDRGREYIDRLLALA